MSPFSTAAFSYKNSTAKNQWKNKEPKNNTMELTKSMR